MAENKFIIEIRTKGFKNATDGLDRLKKKTESYTKSAGQMRGSTAGLRRSIGALRNNLLLISFAFGAVGAAIGKVISVSAKFEAVKTRLVGLTGSVRHAEKAFNTFNKVAATTPFSLQDVVDAGAQLKAFGADAEELIGPITDLAAFMGTTSVEAANAFGRAFAGGAGAADILRERGILNIIKSSQGIADLSKTTLPEFRAALISSLQDPAVGIAGSTERLSKTFVGSFSNMMDSVTRLGATLGDRLMPFAKEAVKSLGNLAEKAREFLEIVDVSPLAFMTEELNRFEETIQGLTVEQLENKLKGLEGKVAEAVNTIETETGKLPKAFATPMKDVVGTIEDIDISKPFTISVEKTKNELDDFTLTLDEQMSKSGDILGGAVDGISIRALEIPEVIKEAGMELETTPLTIPVDILDLRAKIDLIKQYLEELKNAKKDLDEELKDGTVIFLNELQSTLNGFFQQQLSQWADYNNAVMQVNVDAARESTQFKRAQARGDQKEMDRIIKEAKNKNHQDRVAKFHADQALAVSNILMDFLVAKAKGFAQYGPIFGIPFGTAMALLAGAQVATVMAQPLPKKFAQGGDFVTSGPQSIIVGDNPGGMERVQVTPLSSPNISGPAGGSVNISFSGNVLSQDFIENEAIPQIKEAIRRGADIGVS